MKSTTYLLILNMACGDLVISVSTCVSITKYMLFISHWPSGSFGAVLCKLSLYVAIVSFLGCIFSLVGITIDRFMAVSQPMKHKPWSKWTKITIPVIWVTSFLLPLNILLEVKDTVYSRETKCTDVTITFITVIITAFCFLFPFTVMATLYPMISYRLWRRKVPGEFNARQQQMANRTARRVTAMMITVMVVFFVCWAPHFAFSWLHPFAVHLAVKLPLWLIPFTIWLKVFNCAMNPVIYAIFNESFRKGFRDILCCGELRERSVRDLELQQCTMASNQTKREPTQSVQLLSFHPNVS